MDPPVNGQILYDGFLKLKQLFPLVNSVELLMRHFDDRSALMLSNDLWCSVGGTVVNDMHVDAVSFEMRKHRSESLGGVVYRDHHINRKHFDPNREDDMPKPRPLTFT